MVATRWNGVIAIEGEETIDGRLLMPEALTWDEDKFPKRIINVVDYSIVGEVDKVVRRGKLILAEGSIDDEAVNTDFVATMSVDRMEGAPSGITRCRLAGLFVGTEGVWPEARCRLATIRRL